MTGPVMRVLAICCIVLAVTAARARADEAVGVVVTGDPTLAPEVQAHLEDWLRTHTHARIASPLPREVINLIENCFLLDDQECARKVVEARSTADGLVFARIATKGKDVSFSVYWFVKGHAANGERRVCERCTKAAWHALADRTMETLATSGHTELVRHPSSRPPHERPHHGSRLWPGVLLATGIAAAGSGAIFLYYGSLGGPDQKYIYPDSTPVGIGLLAVGIGATIGGAILLHQAGTTSSGPVVSVGPGGAYVGWAHGF
jgi:hypothetical protein